MVALVSACNMCVKLTRGTLVRVTVGLNCMMRLLKQVVNEAAGEKMPEAYPLGYIEDFSSRERSSATDASRRIGGWVGEKVEFSAADYGSRMALWRTVIWVAGSFDRYGSNR